MAKPDHEIGRAPYYAPVAIVDIGSNSVRLVVYDGARRSPTPVYNEKVLCGLGRGVATTGRMNEASVERAIRALSRFRRLAEQIGTRKVYAIATAAAREAENGASFVRQAKKALGESVRVLTGKDEARLAALGVIAGLPDADGIVGDLGGGSLELTVVKDGELKDGVTLPFGPLRLMDMAEGDVRKATSIVSETLKDHKLLDGLEDRRFYAVGGTWRNLARLHIAQHDYPLNVLHNYRISNDSARGLAALVSRLSPASLRDIHAISENRAETMPYGGVVLDRLLLESGVSEMVVSAYGVREGLLFSKLKPKIREKDPLLSAAWDLARARARSPKGVRELCDWTDRLFAKAFPDETREERRLRHVACLLADIGWRAHQDYRGEQSLNVVANAAFAAIDHPGRAFLALTLYFRYEGARKTASPSLEALMDPNMVERSRVLAASMRLAYVLSAFTEDVLPRTVLSVRNKCLTLELGRKQAPLDGEQVTKRMNDLAKLLGLDMTVEADAGNGD